MSNIKSLKELKEKCIGNNFKYSFSTVKSAKEPPILVSSILSTNTIEADNIVYLKTTEIQLALITKEKEPELEEKVETKILNETIYGKEEEYLPEGKVYVVYYSFEI